MLLCLNAEREEAEGHIEEWKLHTEEVPKTARGQFRSCIVLLLTSGHEVGVKGFKHVQNINRPIAMVP